ncbi:hypothetical protein Ac2012v2_008104 [Leucoagaricus gongylophorus]
MSRQQLRRTRLLELEREQRLEDAEGLFMTEEQRQSLLDSFTSVKFEFHDLDGLRWTQTALRRQEHPQRQTILPTGSSNWSRHPVTAYDVDATVRISTCDRRNLAISSPGRVFWRHDPKLALSFRTIPSTHVKQTVSTLGNGLGLICPANKQRHGPITPQHATDFFCDTAWTS